MKNGIFLALIFSFVAIAYETPQAVKDKYRALYSIQKKTFSDGSVGFHEGRLFKRDGVFVLSLKGDQFEMAFQHARLLQKELKDGALPATAALIEKAVRNAIPNIPIVTDAAVEYYYSTYTNAMMDYALKLQGANAEAMMQEAYGLSEGAQVPLDLVIRGVLGPESLQVVLGERLKGKQQAVAAGSANSCTDFLVRGSGTARGEIVIGRNTDYPLNGYFDRYPTVIYYQPTDGTQKYVSVSSAGLHNAGVIGFNESGLFIGIHTIPTTDVSPKGNPAFLVGQWVMQKAKTFDEAIAIFDKYKTGAGWTFTLASVYENRVAAVEISNSKIGVRESKLDYYTQTNHYQTDNMKSLNLDMNATVTEDSHARYLRAEQLIKRNWGRFGAEEAVQILSDKWDPLNQQVRGLGNVIATHMTLSSAVLDMGKRKLYVANGTGPVSLNSYVELPLVSDFNNDSFMATPHVLIENSGFKTEFPRIAAAEQKYIEAKDYFENANNPAKSADILKEAIALDPESSAYLFVHGIISLKANRFADAEESFKQTLNKNYLHYRLASQYYLGRIWASQGKKDAARKIWQATLLEAIPEVEQPLIVAITKNLSKLKKSRKISLQPASLVIFMPEGDMVEY